MDPYRDQLCQDLASRLNKQLHGDEATGDSEQRLWEWLESSEFATEELETISVEELAKAWGQGNF